MIAIQTKGLGIQYGNQKKGFREILSNLDFSANTGECIAVIGQNGSGKSSFLRVISGLQSPSAGSVFWNDQSISEIPLRSRPKFLANMFSQYQRVGGITVRNMVSFGRIPYTGVFGKLTNIDWEKVDEALKIVSMSRFANMPIESLSDGEFRKVMLAKMWAQDAPIMILDEPTSHLDMPSSIEFFNLMRNTAHNDSKAIIFSSHNLPLVFKFADKILAFGSDGEIEFGEPSAILKSAHIQSLFEENNIAVTDHDMAFKFKIE